jgi:hypothetical protein
MKNTNVNKVEERKESDVGEAQEVSIEEYKNLTKRLDTMESSVGIVLTKV